MWFKVLKDLQKLLQDRFPNVKVFIGKRTPPGHNDYPFISLVPVKFRYTDEYLEMEVAMWIGVKVSDKSEEEGYNEFLNLLHALNMFLFDTPTFGFCEIPPETFGVSNIHKQHPYYEGEIDFKIKVPFEVVKNVKLFDGYG